MLLNFRNVSRKFDAIKFLCRFVAIQLSDQSASANDIYNTICSRVLNDAKTAVTESHVAG